MSLVRQDGRAFKSKGRLISQLYVPLINKYTKQDGHADGGGVRGIDIQLWLTGCAYAVHTEEDLMNIIEQLRGHHEEALTLWNQYKDRLDAFRGQVKNDSASLEAQARKTAEATNKMNASFRTVVATLTSAEMQEAVKNAERLAAALDALNSLKSHKLMFATVDSAPNG